MADFLTDYDVRRATAISLGADENKKYDSVYSIDLDINEKTGNLVQAAKGAATDLNVSFKVAGYYGTNSNLKYDSEGENPYIEIGSTAMSNGSVAPYSCYTGSNIATSYQAIHIGIDGDLDDIKDNLENYEICTSRQKQTNSKTGWRIMEDLKPLDIQPKVYKCYWVDDDNNIIYITDDEPNESETCYVYRGETLTEYADHTTITTYKHSQSEGGGAYYLSEWLEMMGFTMEDMIRKEEYDLEMKLYEFHYSGSTDSYIYSTTRDISEGEIIYYVSNGFTWQRLYSFSQKNSKKLTYKYYELDERDKYVYDGELIEYTEPVLYAYQATASSKDIYYLDSEDLNNTTGSTIKVYHANCQGNENTMSTVHIAMTTLNQAALYGTLQARYSCSSITQFMTSKGLVRKSDLDVKCKVGAKAYTIESDLKDNSWNYAEPFPVYSVKLSECDVYSVVSAQTFSASSFDWSKVKKLDDVKFVLPYNTYYLLFRTVQRYSCLHLRLDDLFISGTQYGGSVGNSGIRRAGYTRSLLFTNDFSSEYLHYYFCNFKFQLRKDGKLSKGEKVAIQIRCNQNRLQTGDKESGWVYAVIGKNI